MRSQKRRRDVGSTPDVGSSRNRIGGRCRTAQPSASRCCQPPASVANQILLAPGEAGHVDREAHPLGQLVARHPVDAAEEFQIFLDAEIAIEREFLRHIADALAHALRVVAHVDAGDQRRPALGRNRPHRMRMMVDLPAPFGPRKPMISPRPMRKLT